MLFFYIAEFSAALKWEVFQSNIILELENVAAWSAKLTPQFIKVINSFVLSHGKHFITLKFIEHLLNTESDF